MERGFLKSIGAPGREIAAAAVISSLAPAVGAARYGWQGAALAAPVILLGGVALLACTGRGGRYPAGARWCCTLWGGVLLAHRLGEASARLELTGGGAPGTARWIALIAAGFLLWLCRKRDSAFLRGTSLLLPGTLAVMAAVLLWSGAHIRWGYLAAPAVSVGDGFWAAVEAGGCLIFVLPYIYNDKKHGLGWTAVWLFFPALLPVLLAAVTAGVLSPGVTAVAAEPFFAMAASLGPSFRAEGLFSALWIIPDCVCVSLLTRGGGWSGMWGRSVPVIAGAAAVLLFSPQEISPTIFGVGTLVLWGVVLICLRVGGKNCG